MVVVIEKKTMSYQTLTWIGPSVVFDCDAVNNGDVKAKGHRQHL